MAVRGYLGEGYGTRERDSGRERDRHFGRDRERGGEGGRRYVYGDWGSDPDRSSSERDYRGGGGFGRERSDYDRGRSDYGRGGYGRDEEGGFFGRMGEQVRSWFGDDDDDDERGRWRGSERGGSSWRSDDDDRGGGRGRGREDFGGFAVGGAGRSGREGSSSWENRISGYGSGRETGGGRQRFSANPDDHYLSWRERQLQALDRDYQDYCREREQSFHQDFDSWRRSRQGQSGQSGQSGEFGGAASSGQSSDLGQSATSGQSATGEQSDSGTTATATAGEETSSRSGRSRS